MPIETEIARKIAMSSAVVGMLGRLRERREEQRALCERQLEDAKRAGRTQVSASEQAALRELRELDRRVAEYQSEAARTGDLTSLNARFGGDPSTRTSPMKLNDVHMTYRKHGASWLRDLVLTNQQRDDTGECRARLATHAEEVRTDPFFQRPEYRDLSRVDGTGGYFVPPAWLVDEWVQYARPGRTFANLIQNHPLPGGTDSINVPKILTGTNTAVQTADNAQVFEQDLTDTFLNSPVRTKLHLPRLRVELRAAVSRHWHIDEIRPALIHANVPPAPPDSDVPMPSHDRDEQGRMKLPAYLLPAHKGG